MTAFGAAYEGEKIYREEDLVGICSGNGLVTGAWFVVRVATGGQG